MTEDKDFKRLVRDEARTTGRPYSAVRAERRPSTPPDAMARSGLAERFERLVETIDSWIIAENDLTRLVALALIVPGNVLVRGRPGNGMTALGQGVAAAIGGRLISIDGRDGLEGDPLRWKAGDVVVIGHFDGLARTDQTAVVKAGELPTIVLAKHHPIAGRMPYPPDDETRERFLFSVDLDYGDADNLLRILDDNRTHDRRKRSDSYVTLGDIESMRATVRDVEVPDGVRRYAVEAVAATRSDEAVALGGSVIAALAVVNAAAAACVSAGRVTATVDDVRRVLKPVLAHRLVYRDETGVDIDSMVDRIATWAER